MLDDLALDEYRDIIADWPAVVLAVRLLDEILHTLARRIRESRPKPIRQLVQRPGLFGLIHGSSEHPINSLSIATRW